MRARLFILIVSCFGLVGGAALGTSAQAFSKTSDLPPVRMSYGDLANIVQRASHLIRTTNASFHREFDREHESLDVSDHESTLELTEGISTSSLSSGPEVSYHVTYDYLYSDAPIYHVAVDLSDYSRRVVVKGYSKTDVDAVSSLICGDLNARASSLAGPEFRSVGLLFIFAFAMMLFALGGFARVPIWIRIGLFLSGLVVVVVTSVLPWSDWLPGTSVFAGDSSWFVRHSAVVGFVGTFLTAAAILGSVLVPVLRGLTKPTLVSPTADSGQPSHAEQPSGPGAPQP